MTAFFLKLWVFVRPYRLRLFLGLVFGVLYGVSNGLLMGTVKFVVQLIFEGHLNFLQEKTISKMPHFIQPMVEQSVYWLSQVPMQLLEISVILVIPVVMLLRVIFGYLNIYLSNWAANRAVADIRTRLFAHLQELPLAFFNRSSTGDLISRITSDTQALYGIIGGALSSMVRDPVSLISTAGLLLWLQPKMTLVSLIVFPVCIVPISIYGKKARKSAGAIQASVSELVQLMHESFTGNRIIKAYNLEEAVLNQFRETTARNVSQSMRALRAMEVPSQMMELVGALGVSLVLLYMVFQPSRPKMDDFIMFIGGIFLMYQPFKNLIRLHNQLNQAEAASHRIFELLEMKSTIIEPANPVRLNAAGADIQFENIDFSYGDKAVLSSINLTVKSGAMVALVGSSGSGKTTLANLLLRFFDPEHGVIRIGGVNLREVTTRELRSQIAVVTQETILFNETIRRNIEVGRPGVVDAEIIAAARHAHAHEFIVEKPQGYDTIVGEKGIMLSGGQRQRLAIARAMVKNAPILILDEATSALDTESERAVQAGLDELMKGRTTICIAHRLSTIMHANVIVVLDQGRIVETGRHEELIQRGGTYQKLYELQFRD